MYALGKVGGTSDEVISYANAKPERVPRGTHTYPMRAVWPAAGARSTRRDRRSRGAISEKKSRTVRQEERTRLRTCESVGVHEAEHLCETGRTGEAHEADTCETDEVHEAEQLCDTDEAHETEHPVE